MSQVNFLVHALNPRLAMIGIARMVVGVAAVLEQPPRERAMTELLEESIFLHLAEGGHLSA